MIRFNVNRMLKTVCSVSLRGNALIVQMAIFCCRISWLMALWSIPVIHCVIYPIVRLVCRLATVLSVKLDIMREKWPLITQINKNTSIVHRTSAIFHIAKSVIVKKDA